MVKTNFDYENEELKIFVNAGKKAEKFIYQEPQEALAVFRRLAEALLTDVLEKDRVFAELRITANLYRTQDERIKLLKKYNAKIDPDSYPMNVIDAFYVVKNAGNIAAHELESSSFTVAKALKIDKLIYAIWSWYLEIYTYEETKAYVEPERIDPGNIQDLKKEIAELEKQRDNLQKQNEQQSDLLDRKQRKERLRKNRRYQQRQKLSEDQTRELIDNQLKQAGWQANTKELNYKKNHTMPEKGQQMAIAEWYLPSSGKYIDYALFDGLKLVGIIEAKKWDEDISGDLSQAKEYASLVEERPEVYHLTVDSANQYKVPFIYSTNGRSYVEQYRSKSGIWFRDTRNPYNHFRALAGWHSPEDLRALLNATSHQEADEALKKEANFQFADRYYQIAAIKAVEHAIIAKQDRILLQMATGTGKTRTAIELMYHLLKTKRAKRILYLVDRNSLGKQTEDTLKNLKVDTTALAKIYNVKALTSGKPDRSTKIHIATVQSMIRQLFDDNGTDKITVGAYDFIVVDEAHRGYTLDKEMTEGEERIYDEQDYVSQYRRVIDYFDAVKIAMTATPAKHTVEIFGHAVYSYSYRQAVLDGYLVDHNTPYHFKTELAQSGIELAKDDEVQVFDNETHKMGTETLADNMKFDVSQFNRQIIASGYNRAIAEKLTDYVDPTDEMAGKTLIFAVTDKHADDVVIALKEAYEKAGIPVPDDAIQKITGQTYDYEQAIKNFKNERYPSVVVTVDLLTTGIDVPEITNIVFLRQVRSRILYEQMIGRATRLCDRIHKDSFNIYDAVGIYDKMKPVSNMNMVVSDPHHDVHYFVTQTDPTAYQDPDDFAQYRDDLVTAINRKLQRMPQEARSDFNEYIGFDVKAWVQTLEHKNPQELADQMPILTKLDNFKYQGRKVIIYDEKDQVTSVDRSYGEKNIRPEDYLQAFNAYVNSHKNELLGLEIIQTRSQDLSLKELNSIVLELEQAGYNIKDLQSAEKKVKGEQTAANIISFIRRAMMTTNTLEDHEVMVKRAMNKVYGMADWNVRQQKWLARIEKQLLENQILGKNAHQAFDEITVFRQNGGYRRINKELDGKADEVVALINKNLYA